MLFPTTPIPFVFNLPTLAVQVNFALFHLLLVYAFLLPVTRTGLIGFGLILLLSHFPDPKIGSNLPVLLCFY